MVLAVYPVSSTGLELTAPPALINTRRDSPLPFIQFTVMEVRVTAVKVTVLACVVGSAAMRVSVSVALLLAEVGSAPLLPSSAMVAVFEICPVTPWRMVTAKALEPFAPPPAKLPTVNAHALPTVLSGTHVQPAALLAALKVVLTGTVSVMMTPVAP